MTVHRIMQSGQTEDTEKKTLRFKYIFRTRGCNQAIYRAQQEKAARK